jgi:hypothetical protein
MSKQFFLAQDFFITNTLHVHVYEMYECDKNQMPYCNVRFFRKLIF